MAERDSDPKLVQLAAGSPRPTAADRIGFYNDPMSTESPQQIKANYVRLMGAQTAESFAELMQDAARLHLKWNEFVRLYAASPVRRS